MNPRYSKMVVNTYQSNLLYFEEGEGGQKGSKYY